MGSREGSPREWMEAKMSATSATKSYPRRHSAEETGSDFDRQMKIWLGADLHLNELDSFNSC